MSKAHKDPLDLANTSKSTLLANSSDSDDNHVDESELSSTSSDGSDLERWLHRKKKPKSADSVTDVLQVITADMKSIKTQLKRDAKERAIQRKTLLRLTKEVYKLRKEMKALSQRTTFENEALSVSLMPREPFETIGELMSFDNEMKGSEEKLAQLTKELTFTAANTAQKFVKANWKRFMTSNVAAHFTWKGTVTKASSQALCIAMAIRDAFRARYNDEDDTRFLEGSKKYFQYTSDTVTRKRKNNYRTLKPKEEPTQEFQIVPNCDN